jgi:hypothetical protein
MAAKQKAQIVVQIVEAEKSLASRRFAKFGLLYCADSPPRTCPVNGCCSIVTQVMSWPMSIILGHMTALVYREIAVA